MPLPKTKIVCTLGPSSWNPEILREMIANGMTVARMNGAFTTLDDMRRVSDVIRSVSKDVALMIDIKGHEVRLNRFENDVLIAPGDSVIFGSDSSEYIFTETYPELYLHIQAGAHVLVDDGRTLLTVEKVEDKKIFLKVISGSKIPKGKGINIPGVFLDNPPITDKDREQIEFAVKDKWDFVAASFVRNKEDVQAVKELLKGSHTKVISKIEDSFGLKNIDEIITESEGIMVARGDLAVEIPYYQVPHVQKEIIQKCNAKVKPVIVATQMLESMISNPVPTRAETSDIANAIFDGADAVMLSGETTTGQYPLECVKVMKEIAIETEKIIYQKSVESNELYEIRCEIRDDGTRTSMYMAEAAAIISKSKPDAKVIVDTRTGFSARLISSYNILTNVIAYTPYEYYARRLALSKGIRAFTKTSGFTTYRDYQDFEMNTVIDLKNRGIVSVNDTIILVTPSGYSFTTAQHEKAAIKILHIQ